MTTPYHSQLWAHRLTLNAADGSVATLGRAISTARVDLNPHQVDAALFALRSPLARGVLLADEVGLGKTIEAGLVIAQRWAERRRRILLVLPATLRKQWQAELEEKFHLPSIVLDGAALKARAAAGEREPFERQDALVLCSYAFAARHADRLRRVRWDLVVLDEAHRLRNVYQGGKRRAVRLRDALHDVPKLLLTATPLQNSLMELYGLVSVIDPHLFGDAASFRDQYVRAADPADRDAELRVRLQGVCARTLRRQVQPYIRFTRRTPITQAFETTPEERRLYDGVTAYLQRPRLVALPNAQRALMTLVLRKLLASSTFAIAGTLARLTARVEAALGGAAPHDALSADFEGLDDLEDEWEVGVEPVGDADTDAADAASELRTLRDLTALAHRIERNAKGDALLAALEVAFARAADLGAARKAVVFTESRRTQAYLADLLEANGYAGEVATINGSNDEPRSQATYRAWLDRHAADGRATGVRGVDVKAALVDAFRDHATILVATEAAAEGVNLQFCSLVVNYDLPWNPQRVEQRIGRCHRYGQRHDVVVVNLLDEGNAADRRVFQLLAEKFALFDGVFGASDEVLGALGSGVGLERRIADLYQTCRTPAEIEVGFDALQRTLEDEIRDRLADTRRAVLDHLDEQVQARLQVHRDAAQACLDDRQRWLLGLTRVELGAAARFAPDAPSFHLTEAPTRRYDLRWQAADAEGAVFYHLDHPLAARLVSAALDRSLSPATLHIDYRGSGARIAALAPLIGRSGWLSAAVLEVDALSHEQHLLCAAVETDGRPLDAEQIDLLLGLPARVADGTTPAPPPAVLDRLRAVEAEHLADADARNAAWFDERAQTLDAWAHDLKRGLEAKLRDLDRQLGQAKRDVRPGAPLLEKLAAQRAVRDLEGRRSRLRRELFDAQDAVDRERDALIGQIEAQLERRHDTKPLFTVRWTLD